MSDVIITGGTSIIAEFPPIENVAADTVYIQGPPGTSGTGGGVDSEAVQDIVGALIVGAGGTYDDAAGTITLPAGSGGTRPALVVHISKE